MADYRLRVTKTDGLTTERTVHLPNETVPARKNPPAPLLNLAPAPTHSANDPETVFQQKVSRRLEWHWHLGHGIEKEETRPSGVVKTNVRKWHGHLSPCAWLPC